MTALRVLKNADRGEAQVAAGDRRRRELAAHELEDQPGPVPGPPGGVARCKSPGSNTTDRKVFHAVFERVHVSTFHGTPHPGAVMRGLASRRDGDSGKTGKK